MSEVEMFLTSKASEKQVFQFIEILVHYRCEIKNYDKNNFTLFFKSHIYCKKTMKNIFSKYTTCKPTLDFFRKNDQKESSICRAKMN